MKIDKTVPERYKGCYCFTCDKRFHYLGINRHVAMHRDKREICKVKYTYGNIVVHKFSTNESTVK